MTAPHNQSQPGTAPAIQLCPLCKKAPGQKVGPPALVRCINSDCEGTKLAALTPDEWNTRANWSDFAASAADTCTPSPAGAREALAQKLYELRNDTRNYRLQADDILAALRAPAQCGVQTAHEKAISLLRWGTFYMTPAAQLDWKNKVEEFLSSVVSSAESK